MESDLGKLFIGGISWDTDEERLKEYFGNYGEVVEAVIMRDRTTGRARGFGFVVFADPAIAERVTRDKHMIDGRSVEAKKAVPRDDHHLLNRGPASIPSSPNPGRTKKIFVGGLASNVTESDFKNYFDQFGSITDVVVMYDHNTQRPRGFGFITYDSEDAVDRVLQKTFHDLNGKMVEVKRAVPKELSPGLNRSPLVGYSHNLSRLNNFLNSYSPGFNLASMGMGGYRVRMDGGHNPILGRGSASPFSTLGLGLDQGFAGGSNLVNALGYGRLGSPYSYGGNSGRYNTPIGYQGEIRRRGSGLSPNIQSLWGNGGFGNASSNPINLGPYVGTGNGGGSWGPGPNLSNEGGLSYGSGDGGFGFGGEGSGRMPTNFGGNLEESYGDIYQNSSVYGDSAWLSGASPEMNGPSSFSYGLGDVSARGSEGFVGSYSNAAIREPSTGIAA